MRSTAKLWVRKVMGERRAEGLNLPYGMIAQRLGLGPLLPSRKLVHDADEDDTAHQTDAPTMPEARLLDQLDAARARQKRERLA
jgi:hypothetical protein